MISPNSKSCEQAGCSVAPLWDQCGFLTFLSFLSLFFAPRGLQVSPSGIHSIPHSTLAPPLQPRNTRLPMTARPASPRHACRPSSPSQRSCADAVQRLCSCAAEASTLTRGGMARHKSVDDTSKHSWPRP